MTTLLTRRGDPVRRNDLPAAVRRRYVGALALLSAALLLGAAPSSWTEWSGVVQIDQRPFGHLLPAVVALAAVAFAVRLAWTAGGRLGYERPIGVALGIMIAALSGDQARAFLELAVLRRWWGIAETATAPARLLPILWITAAGIVTLAGLLGGVALALLAAAPAVLRRRLPWIAPAGRRIGAFVSWLPAAHVGMVLVGQLFISPGLMGALGTIGPDREGIVLAHVPEFIFFGMWPHLATLGFIQFTMGLWSGVEFARFADEEVTARPRLAGRTASKALAIAAVAGALISAAIASRGHLLPVLPAGGLEEWKASTSRLATDLFAAELSHPSFAVALVAALAVALPVAFVMVLSADEGAKFPGAGLVARIRPQRNRTDGDAALLPVLPVVALLTLIVLWSYATAALASLVSAFRFPFDASGFYDYWAVATTAPAYAAVDLDNVLWPGLIMLAILGLLACVWEPTRWLGMLFGPALLGMAVLVRELLNPATILLLFASFVLALWYWRLQDADADIVDAGSVFRAGIVCAAALTITLLPDLPVVVPLAFAVVLRFGWQAGMLNKDTLSRSDHILFTVSLPLLLAGLVLAEASTGEELRGSALASVGQVAGICFVGLPFAIGLGIVASQRSRSSTAQRLTAASAD